MSSLSHRLPRVAPLVGALLAVAACSGDATPPPADTGLAEDTGAAALDAAPDTGASPLDVADALAMDLGADTRATDTGAPETGPSDTGPSDTGPSDTGAADTGRADTGRADTGRADTGVDAGPGPYPAGPYGVRVGDVLANLTWEGFVNPAGDVVSTMRPYSRTSLQELRGGGRGYALIHLSESL